MWGIPSSSRPGTLLKREVTFDRARVQQQWQMCAKIYIYIYFFFYCVFTGCWRKMLEKNKANEAVLRSHHTKAPYKNKCFKKQKKK